MKHKPEAITPLFCAALLIFGTPGSGAQSADNTLKGPPAAVKSSFEAVAARLDPNGHLYAYLSTEQALARLGEGLEGLITLAKTGTEAGSSLMDNPFVAPIIEGVMDVVEPAYRQSGIGEISGVGMSSLALEEDLWRSKMFVHHQPGKGSGLIWDAFGEQPHTLEVLSLAPDNTAALMHSDLDVKRIIDWADTVFEEMLGGESIMANAPPQVQGILDSFGNEAGFLMTLDAENKMTLPGFMFDRQDDLELDGVAFALLLRVNDDTLMEMLGEAMGGGFGAPEGTKVGGVTIHSIPLPIPLPIKMDLSPCYFQVGNYMVLSSAESLAKRLAEAHGGKGRLVDDADFKALAKGLSLKANGIYYADPQATEWGMQINELSMGKLEGGLAKVYEIYKESLKEGIGMVSLFKVEKDGLLIEGNSTVNPYGGNIVHSIAGVGVAVASSLNDLQQSGLFEDLGGFDGPPGFDDEPDFDLPRVTPPDDDELDLESAIQGFYEEFNISEEEQLTKEQMLKIAQGEDDRSNIPKEFDVLHIHGTKLSINISLFTPDGQKLPGPPEFYGTQKFVDGKYFVQVTNVPKAEGGFDRNLTIFALSQNKTRFVVHDFFDNELRGVWASKSMKDNKVEWEGRMMIEPPNEESFILSFDVESDCSREKDEHKGVAFRDGVPLFKRTGTATKS
jgi:hypothetical protein